MFWVGFTIMFLNEGFVIMRHVHPWFAEKRKQLHDRFGEKKVKRIHGFTDWTWIGFIILGYYLDFSNWPVYTTALGLFWGVVAVGVYLPMLYRKLTRG
mgnify:CR=1 FL=1|tara:strand:+ start:327 stop:620 length:294 start_codon:yes stop_codon:yes gene_type:complete